MSIEFTVALNRLTEALDRMVNVFIQQNARSITPAPAGGEGLSTQVSSAQGQQGQQGQRGKKGMPIGEIVSTLAQTAGSSADIWGQISSVASTSTQHPYLATAMAGIYAAKHVASQQEGIPYGRFELEFAKYTKPRADMSEMAESLGASSIVKDKEWWSKTFEMKKTQREAVEENIKSAGQVSALAPATEIYLQRLVSGMSQSYEKLAQSLDIVVKTQAQMLGIGGFYR